MFSIESVVFFIVYLLVAGLIFGLLVFLIDYVTGQFPVMAPFGKIAKIILVILAVLVLIGILLSFIGHPLIRLTP